MLFVEFGQLVLQRGLCGGSVDSILIETRGGQLFSPLPFCSPFRFPMRFPSIDCHAVVSKIVASHSHNDGDNDEDC